MIHTTLEIIKEELSNYFRDSGSVFSDPNLTVLELGNIAMIDAFNEDHKEEIEDKIVISLVNIDQDKVLRNGPTFTRTTDENGKPTILHHNPTVYLNLYILFSAHQSNYLDALRQLSTVIEFFQRQFVFSGNEIPQLQDGNIEKLIFDMYTMGFDQLNQLWGVLGGKYIPSIMYKVRVVPIQRSDEQPGPAITSYNTKENIL